MTDDLREQIIRWIVENVDETVVPCDEGSDDGLVYNLVNLARHGRTFHDKWAYNRPDQRAEVKALRATYPPPPETDSIH